MDEAHPNPDPPPARRRRPLAFVIVLLVPLVGLAVWYGKLPGLKTRAMTTPGPRITRLNFSPERGSRYLAAAQSDGRVRLWEAATKRELPVKLRSEWPLHDLAWASDGMTLFVGGFEEHVLTWNVRTSRSITLPKFPGQIVSLAARPRKTELLVSLANGELWWVNPSSQQRESIKSGHTGIVKVVRYHPSGKTFVTAGVDQQLVWHDVEARTVTQAVPAHQHEISSLAFSPDGSRLISGSWDKTAKVWRHEGKEPLATFTHPDGVAAVAWRGDEVVTTCWDGRLRVWNVGSGSITQERPCRSDSLAFDVWPGRNSIAEVDSSGALQLETP